MIKLYTTKAILEGGLVVASTDKDEADDTEGYFVTVEELRELFADWDTYRIAKAQNGEYWKKNMSEIFNQWLASKGVKGE